MTIRLVSIRQLIVGFALFLMCCSMVQAQELSLDTADELDVEEWGEMAADEDVETVLEDAEAAAEEAAAEAAAEAMELDDVYTIGTPDEVIKLEPDVPSSEDLFQTQTAPPIASDPTLQEMGIDTVPTTGGPGPLELPIDPELPKSPGGGSGGGGASGAGICPADDTTLLCQCVRTWEGYGFSKAEAIQKCRS